MANAIPAHSTPAKSAKKEQTPKAAPEAKDEVAAKEVAKAKTFKVESHDAVRKDN